MMRTNANLKAMAAALVDRTRNFLTGHIGIDVTGVHAVTVDGDHLALRRETAVIGVGGNAGALIAFSFPEELVDVLYMRLTAGLGIPQGEQALYRRETISEIANVIVGHCTADFATDGEHIAMTPPVFLEDAKELYRMHNATLGTIEVHTSIGSFDIHLVGSREGLQAIQMEYGLDTENGAAQRHGRR
jgi:CheY-specific phosphatase CheX